MAGTQVQPCPCPCFCFLFDAVLSGLMGSGTLLSIVSNTIILDLVPSQLRATWLARLTESVSAGMLISTLTLQSLYRRSLSYVSAIVSLAVDFDLAHYLFELDFISYTHFCSAARAQNSPRARSSLCGAPDSTTRPLAIQMM